MHLYKVYFASTADAVYVWAASCERAELLASTSLRKATMYLVSRYLYSRNGEVERVAKEAA